MPGPTGSLTRSLATILALFVAATGTGALAAPVKAQEPEEYASVDVDVYLHTSGGDAIDIYVYDEEGWGSVSRTFARRIAGIVAPGVPIEDIRGDEFDPSYLGVQFDGRVAQRDRGAWLYQVDTRTVQSTAAEAGYPYVNFMVCVPDVERSLEVSRPADDDYSTPGTDECPVWYLEPGDEPVSVAVRLVPDAGRYTDLVATVAGIAAFLTALAAGLAVILRRRVFMVLTGPALALGLTGAALAFVVPLVGAAVLAAAHGPVAAYVLDRNLSAPGEFIATVAPALLGVLAPLVFAVILLGAPPDVDGESEGDRAARSAPPGYPTWLP